MKRWYLLLLFPIALFGIVAVARADTTYVVQPGDSLSRISQLYNVTIEAIAEANDIANPRIIVVGRELIIPGVDGPTTGQPTTPAPAPTAAPDAGPRNLFRNGSFEGGWYFFNYNELQVPNNWQLAVDEGPNTLDPGSGGDFNRPEVRLVTRAQLPEAEWDWFIADGEKSLKVFKGGAPTAFSLFQDVELRPGRYRMTLNFFPDIVAHYNQGNREFHTDPLAGEVRVIHNNGGGDWETVTAGERNTVTYDFTVNRAGTARLGADFRNRFETANNGWFLDHWRLERLGN